MNLAPFAAGIIFLASALPAAEGQGTSQSPSSRAVRGTVTDTAGTPLQYALVSIDSAGTPIGTSVQTNERGEYLLPYRGFEMSAWVTVQTIGFRRQRRQALWSSESAMTVAVDFRLLPFVAMLDATHTVAERPLASRDAYRPVAPSGTETKMDRSSGLSGDLSGDPTAALGQIPGIILKTNPDGSKTASAFGLDGDQNGATLNGSDFSGVLPRDGLLQTVRMSTYDPKNGRFGGVQISSTLGGGQVISLRTARITLDSPALQFASGGTTAVGTKVQDIIASGTASGPLVGARMFWSSSGQIEQRTSDVATLGSPVSAVWEHLNVSADSVRRLQDIAGVAGIPLHAGGIPASTTATSGSGILRVDFTPNAQALGDEKGAVIYALASGSWRDAGGLGGNPFALQTRLSHTNQRQGQLLLSYSPYFGSVLSETRSRIAFSDDQTVPYVNLPAARLLLTSELPGGVQRLANLELGGASNVRRAQTLSWEGSSEVSWMTMSGAHRFNLYADAEWQRYMLNQNANALGTFLFSSLADLEQGRPSAFSRTFPSPATSGNLWQGVVAFSDLYNVSQSARGSFATSGNGLTLQYGIRIDAQRFSVTPESNAAIQSAFDVRNNRVPNAISFQPMIGFTRSDGIYSVSKGGGRATSTRSQLDGGFRLYRGTLSPFAVDQASRLTGIPGAPSTLQCVGTAVPTPDWKAFVNSSSAIPQSCVAGSSPEIGGAALPVQFFGSGYAVPESWRAELKWTWLFTGQLSGDVGANYANNRQQTSTTNLNFSGNRRFVLASEGARPVYVSTAGIDPQSGQLSSVGSRAVPNFADVTEIGSGRSSVYRGFTAGLTYHIGTSRFPSWETNPKRFHATVRAWYSYADQREQVAGFDATTSGDPRQTTWERGDRPRHTVQLTVDSHLDRWFDLSFSARLASGSAFTPMVNSDINGDGRSNDRAFIFNPSLVADSTLSAGLRTVMGSAPGYAQRCLTNQIGRIAGVNSCTGPWSASLGTVSLTIDPFRLGLGNRGSLTLYVQNALGGLDQLINGDRHLHGWGDPTYPDPVLLVVRGFDQSQQSFRYTVNPVFGSGDVFRAAFHQPTKITLDFRLQLHRNIEVQAIEGTMKYSPRPLSATSLKGFLLGAARGSGEWSLDRIIWMADSLELNSDQLSRLNDINRRVNATRDTVYGSLATFLVAQDGIYGTPAVRDRWHLSIEASVRSTFAAASEARAVFSPEQFAWLRSRHMTLTLERSQDWLDLTTRGYLPSPR